MGGDDDDGDAIAETQETSSENLFHLRQTNHKTGSIEFWKDRRILTSTNELRIILPYDRRTAMAHRASLARSACVRWVTGMTSLAIKR